MTDKYKLSDEDLERMDYNNTDIMSAVHRLQSKQLTRQQEEEEFEKIYQLANDNDSYFVAGNITDQEADSNAE